MKIQIFNGRAIMPPDYRKAEKIIELVCDHYNMTYDEMRVNLRDRDIRYPRQVAMYVMRERTNLSRREIGEYFDKDTTTVFHAWKLIGDQYEIYPELRDLINEIETKI
jgi:chromosomal replication initiator protein